MDKSNKINNKDNVRLFSKICFSIGLLGNVVFILLISIAHYFAIENGYDWKVWELSELVLYGSTSKILFNFAVIFNGFCLLFLTFPITNYFQKLKIPYLILVIIIALSLICIGAVSEDIFQIVHVFFAGIFFILTTCLILFISTYIIIKKKELSVFYPFSGFFVALFLIFHLATRPFFGMAYTQRIAIFISMVFLMAISGKILLSDFNPFSYEKI